MNRRRFLLSGSMAAIAATLPIHAVHAVAATPAYPRFDSATIEKLGLIEQALDVGELYGFDLPTRVTLFGLNPRTIGSHAELREVVQKFLIDYGGIDIWNRVRFLVAIKGELERRFPENLVAQMQYIAKPPELFGKVSVHEMMTSTHYADLADAARLIGCIVEPHGFAEMQNFVG